MAEDLSDFVPCILLGLTCSTRKNPYIDICCGSGEPYVRLKKKRTHVSHPFPVTKKHKRTCFSITPDLEEDKSPESRSHRGRAGQSVLERPMAGTHRPSGVDSARVQTAPSDHRRKDVTLFLPWPKRGDIIQSQSKDVLSSTQYYRLKTYITQYIIYIYTLDFQDH